MFQKGDLVKSNTSMTKELNGIGICLENQKIIDNGTEQSNIKVFWFKKPRIWKAVPGNKFFINTAYLYKIKP